MLIELGIPEAEDAADELLPDARPAAAPKLPTEKPKLELVNFSAVPGYTFAKAAGMTDDEALQLATDAADQVIEDSMIAPIAQMLAEFEASGKTLQEFSDALQDMGRPDGRRRPARGAGPRLELFDAAWRCHERTLIYHRRKP